MRKIGTFVLLRPIVAKSSASLFEARGTRSGRPLLVLLPRIRGAATAEVVPFLDGAPRLAALSHPNIARVHELGIEEGQPYIAMEAVRGVPLDSLLRSEARPAGWKIRVVSQICEALAYAHGQALLHLDLRPASVLVTPAGDVRIIGFGVAPLRSAVVEADFSYAAPELIAGRAADHRADIFSVGALAHEMFSDRPFKGGRFAGARNATERRQRSLPKTEYSPLLDVIVTTALAEDPADRQQRMVEMCKALDGLVYDSVDVFFERMLQVDRTSAAPAPAEARAHAITAERETGRADEPDRVQVLYTMALGQAAEGRLEEASKLANAIRRLAPDDPRNDEITAYLLAEAETAVESTLAFSPSATNAGDLHRRLERVHGA